MIDAVTYGMIPSAKSEKRESAEPEKRFSSERMPPPEKRLWSAFWSTPGAGTHEPRRYAPRTAAVKSTRLRSSGTRHAFESQENISASPGRVATLLGREHQALQGRREPRESNYRG